MPAYKRILLKLSGEVLAGGASFGIDAERVQALADEVAEVAARRRPDRPGGGRRQFLSRRAAAAARTWTA